MDTNDPVAGLYARAKHHGFPMADICQRAGVAATTPSRWRNKRNGANFGTLHKLNSALDAMVADRTEAA